MAGSIERIEERIGRAARRFPGVPRREVLLTRLLAHAHLRINDALNRSLKRHGLNATSWIALMMIYASAGNRIVPSDLSAVVASSRTHATRLADELLERGLISRRISAEDRRKTILSLTADGVALIERLLPEQRLHTRRLWDAFTAAELAHLEELLRRLLVRLESPS